MNHNNTKTALEEKLATMTITKSYKTAIMYSKAAGVYHSPNIVRVIESRRLRWAGHVAGMEKGRSAFKILIGKPTGKRP